MRSASARPWSFFRLYHCNTSWQLRCARLRSDGRPQRKVHWATKYRRQLCANSHYHSLSAQRCSGSTQALGRALYSAHHSLWQKTGRSSIANSRLESFVRLLRPTLDFHKIAGTSAMRDWCTPWLASTPMMTPCVYAAKRVRPHHCEFRGNWLRQLTGDKDTFCHLVRAASMTQA